MVLNSPPVDGQSPYACPFRTCICARATTGRKFLYVSLLYPQHDSSQLSQGVMICVTGLGLLVASDQLTNKDWAAPNKGKGDAFMILGATLYGFSTSSAMMLVRETDRYFVANATEEFFVRKRPLYEVVGQLGMWGTIINGIQASCLEHKKWKESTWSGENSMSRQS